MCTGLAAFSITINTALLPSILCILSQLSVARSVSLVSLIYTLFDPSYPGSLGTSPPSLSRPIVFNIQQDIDLTDIGIELWTNI
jgi:hypothetical protein